MKRTISVFLGVIASLHFSVPTSAQAPDSTSWDRLPMEAREVVTDTLLPRIAVSDLVDLDGNGSEEILLMSQSALAPDAGAKGLGDLMFQSLLMIFERVESQDQVFPYKLTVLKALSSKLPKPAHLSFQNMGGEAAPEIVWLQGGPDAEGRYSEAILYTYRSGLDDPLVEAARFSTPGGWIRLYDLDSDGASEAVAFAQRGTETVCEDVLFHASSDWITLMGAIRNLGFPDVQSFQVQHGLEPNGKISRPVFEKLKGVLGIPRGSGPAPGSAQPPTTVDGWEFVDEP